MVNLAIPPIPEGIIPTQLQHYLLKAATADYATACSNWELFKQLIGIDKLDSSASNGPLLPKIYDKIDIGSNRLLPMVYKNLKPLNDPWLKSIKSFYSYTYAKNQYYFNLAQQFAALCEEQHTDLILLKGLAIAFYYANEPGLRVMEDVDVMLDPQHIEHLLNILTQKYTTTQPYKLGKFFNYLHAATFKVAKTSLDVHWRLFHTQPKQWNIFAEKSAFIKLDKNILVLNPTYAFFHSIVHGVQPNLVPTIRWISDCYLIAKQQQIEWQIIIHLALELGYIERLRVAVKVLPNYGVVIPESVVAQINQFKLEPSQLYFLKLIASMGCGVKHGIWRKVINNIKYFYFTRKIFLGKNAMSIICHLPTYLLFKVLAWIES